MRGTNEQTTKFRAANVWWTGGGWWTRPVIGSKSPMLKRVRPEVAVPADDVERVMRVVVGRQPVAHLDVDAELALVGPGRDLVGEPDVALRVGRVLEQLAVVVAVALGRLDLRRALEVEHPLGAPRVGRQPPGRADRQDEVVAGAVADRPEVRVEQALALVDVEQLVGLAVAVEDGLGHRLGGADDAHHDVAVEEERDAPGDRVAVRLDAGRVDQPVVVVAVVGLLEA